MIFLIKLTFAFTTVKHFLSIFIFEHIILVAFVGIFHLKTKIATFSSYIFISLS